MLLATRKSQPQRTHIRRVSGVSERSSSHGAAKNTKKADRQSNIRGLPNLEKGKHASEHRFIFSTAIYSKMRETDKRNIK